MSKIWCIIYDITPHKRLSKAASYKYLMTGSPVITRQDPTVFLLDELTNNKHNKPTNHLCHQNGYKSRFWATERVEWGELASILWSAICKLLAHPSYPWCSPPSVPAELELHTDPQPVESQDGGYDGYIPEEAAPQMFEQQIPLNHAPITHYRLCQNDIR